MAQFVAISGSSASSDRFTYLRQCASTAGLALPPTHIPAGSELQPKPALNSFSAPEPAGGRPVVGLQAIRVWTLLTKTPVGSPEAPKAKLITGENSPTFGALNDVPQAPR